MFNVNISFNQPTNKREEFVNRITKARDQILDDFIEREIIKEFTKSANRIQFCVNYGGTDEFLQRLPNLIWHFRVLDKGSVIKLEAVPAV